MKSKRLIPKTAIVTYSGLIFDFVDPTPESINIIDIAYHLSNICRYTGTCKSFYSVAEHSVRMALSKELNGAPMDRLLHDAAEAYIGDLSSPLKQIFPGDWIKNMEGKILKVISEALNWIPWSNQKDVKIADRIMMATEIRDLMPIEALNAPQIQGFSPLREKIIPWTPLEARWRFLITYEMLQRRT